MWLIERAVDGLLELLRRTPRRWTEPLTLVLAIPLFLLYRRAVVLANLERVFGEWSPRRRRGVAFASYRQMGRTLIELLQMDRYDDGEIRERVEVENLGALEAAHAEGRGVVVLTGHFGNWEWLGRRFLAQGYRAAVISRELGNRQLNEWVRRLHEGGVSLIRPGNVRAALRWLREGGWLWIMMDQEPFPKDSVVAPFFGRPALTHAGPFRLARISGAPVFTMFIRRVGPSRYQVRAEPFPLSDAANPDRAIAEDAAAFNGRLEAAIRRDPDQWLWTHRRWKRSQWLAPDAAMAEPL